MPRYRIASVLILVTAVAACGGKSPAAPTGTTVTGLAITGADTLLTGGSSVYHTTATFADGASRTVTPNWSSSNPEVASVDDAGQLQPRAHGTTILTATSGGQTVSKTVHIVNNYAGRWDGVFAAKECAPQSFCAAMDLDIFNFPVTLELSQSGADQSDIAGRFILRNFGINASVTGRVTSEGHLNLAGSYPVTDNANALATLNLEAWDTTSRDGAMSGGWAQRVVGLQPVYTEYLRTEIVRMERTSSTTPQTSRR
jgi:hypothetical protein